MQSRLTIWILLVLFFARASNGQRLTDKSLSVIKTKEDIVSRMAAKAAELFQSRAFALSNCECSTHSCSFEFPGARCHERLGTVPKLCGDDCRGQLIDYNRSIIRMPPGTNPDDMNPSIKESICTYRGLDDLFRGLFPDAYAWTYVGTTDGHFRRWPAAGRQHDNPSEAFLHGCRGYDPRTRPWYIAASTGPKDIVFVIDKSGSMLDASKPGRPLKWNTTTEAVLAMINTLGTTDYVNVVAFSDGAEQLWTENSLARGTNQNKELIKANLKRQVPHGGTNFDAAFELAFTLLTNACSVERKTCSNCEKVIIFLTDGKDTSRSLDGGIKPSKMAAKIAGYQDKLQNATSRRASIFTFSMGSDADDSIPRQIACGNDGSWSFIRDTDDPLTAMRSYYLFLTARRLSGSPIWTEPYEDDSGLGRITTVAKPIFSRGSKDTNGVFLGVAGHDVFFSELGKTDSEQDTIIEELVERGSRCDPFIADKCQLQVLRNVYANRATCIDRFPITSTPPSEPDAPQCFTNGRSFYKRFSSLLSWNEARDLCTEDGGALASIGSPEELSFVANMASDDGTWIGARRQLNVFVWLDATSPDLTDSSQAWGIGQPNGYKSVEDCVSIDTRGPTGNLNDASCEEEHTFICEYASDDSCKGDVLNPRDQKEEFFTVPPVDLCINAEESITNAGTLSEAKNLKRENVICPLGDKREDPFFRCCKDCSPPQTHIASVTPQNSPVPEDNPSSSGGIAGSVVIILATVLSIMIVAGCIAFLLLHKRRLTTKTVEPIPHPSFESHDIMSGNMTPSSEPYRNLPSLAQSVTTATSEVPSYVTGSQV